jgi:hypothetical protein
LTVIVTVAVSVPPAAALPSLMEYSNESLPEKPSAGMYSILSLALLPPLLLLLSSSSPPPPLLLLIILTLPPSIDSSSTESIVIESPSMSESFASTSMTTGVS